MARAQPGEQGPLGRTLPGLPSLLPDALPSASWSLPLLLFSSRRPLLRRRAALVVVVGGLLDVQDGPWPLLGLCKAGAWQVGGRAPIRPSP